MPTPLPEAYVAEFLTTCMDAGVCKEAAYILLCKASFDRELNTNPAYRAGVEEMCKKADETDWSLPAYGALAGAGATGAYYARKPIADSLTYMGRQLAEGAKNTATGATRLGRGLQWLGTHHIEPNLKKVYNAAKAAPGPVKALAGLTALGAGVGGLIARDHSSQNWVNKLPSGVENAYDPQTAAAAQKSTVDTMTSGLSQLNKDSYPKALRLQELKNAVNSGAPGSAAALPEIKKLEGEMQGYNQQYGKIRDAYQGTVANKKDYQGKLENQSATEANRSNSMWTGLRRWLGYHHLPGGMDTDGADYYGDRQTKLRAEHMRAQDSIRAAQESLERANRGYTAPSAPAATLPITSPL